MDFNEGFETVKNFAVDTAQAAARKARLLAFIAKNNMAILAEQDKQKKAYTELGKLYYRDFVTGEEPDEAEYMPWCEKITVSVKTVEDAKAAIEKAKAEDAAFKANAAEQESCTEDAEDAEDTEDAENAEDAEFTEEPADESEDKPEE